MRIIAGFPTVAALATLRDRYWFLPALSALLGLFAGVAVVAIDIRLGDDWLGNFKALHGSRPEGGRAMLSTIAGSTITVAGVVFSITLAAVTYASGQHGPRLLTNFARDRGNQLTLGVFIATYVYCLIVLRTIRSAGEDGNATAFVPQLAVYVALALALASIGVLIYFFHHVTDTIHINNVIARIGRKMIAALREGADAGSDSDHEHASGSVGSEQANILAHRAGYIETIEHSDLYDLAVEHDLVLRVPFRPGDFILSGAVLLSVSADKPLPESISESLRSAFSIGNRRTDLQDLRFGFDELTEIAIRALSPGINDPFTAIACIDWLTAALAECEKSVSDVPATTSATSRLQTSPLLFSDFVNLTFGRMRQHVASEIQVRSATLEALSLLADNASSPHNRTLLLLERAQLLAH